MTEVEVYLDWHGSRRHIGLLRRHHGRGRERVSFAYTQEWIDAPDRFSIDPALPVGRNVFTPPKNREMFATLGDSAPDTWGRNLMRRRGHLIELLSLPTRTAGTLQTKKEFP